ncbi:hypothetical protein HY78_06875 [Rhizorhabdus wittichii DC-6]|nr:hypothetical protein HY78_06875 [Rhizorhabdus wittichii DC-6]
MPNLPPPFGASIRLALPRELADENALLVYLGLSPKELRKIWWCRARMYQHFDIAKGRDKVRTISAPDKRLKYLQRKLAALLTQIYRPRHPVHGFVVGRSVKTNAVAHLQKRYILNIDVKDFFPSITENRVEGLLHSLGVDMRVAAIITRIVCNEGCLPQGAPTSPILSNMICFTLDRRLMALARDNRCIYTRYADDITFSSHQPLASLFEGASPSAGQITPDLLSPALRDTFVHNGFALNPDKAHYADRHSRRTVTGLKVNELLNVDRRFVRNLRAALHSVETLGIAAAQQVYQDRYGGSASLGAHLEGKIGWLRHIRGQSDPVFRALALRFNACFPDRELRLTPTVSEIRDRAVWLVENDETIEQGTAFFLAGAGLVTAAHCVEKATELTLYHPSKPANKFVATVLKCDAHRDLALLGHDIPPTEYFELERSTAAVLVGQELTAAGYPGFGPGDRLNVRLGTVTSLPIKRGVHMIEVSQKLGQGMSGGPVLDEMLGLVGVIHRGGPGEARDFAIHLDVLNCWLAEE